MQKYSKYIQLYGGGDKPQWSVLKHNGPMFPSIYIPHKTKILVKGNETELNELAEEYGTMFAKYLGTDYMEMSNFKKNFWKDFKPTVNDMGVNSIDDFDFSNYKIYLDKQKELKSLLTKEEKELIKKKQEQEEEPFKNCIIDGAQQKIGNFKIEPPGIFIGRGSHPKLGRIKKRIRPEDVYLNLGKEATIPTPKYLSSPPPGSFTTKCPTAIFLNEYDSHVAKCYEYSKNSALLKRVAEGRVMEVSQSFHESVWNDHIQYTHIRNAH
jgi:DNA topoisomerase-1